MIARTEGRSPGGLRGRLQRLSLFALVLGIYILTMSGHTYSPDEETMLEASRGLVERASWAMPASGSLVQVEGAGGLRYSQYGPGQSLAAVPWVAAGKLVGALFPRELAGFPLRLVLGTYNALIAAGIAALFAAFGALLGYTRRASVAGGLALAFCTYLWPHSRTFFSEPLTALALLGAFYLLARAYLRDEGGGVTRVSLLMAAGSGALVALVAATKVQYVVALPAFLLYTGWNVWRAPSMSADIHGPQRWRVPLAWLAGLLVGLAPLMLYNLLIFGAPLSTGYGLDAGNTLTNLWYEGVFGLLLSPGKGLVWYALPIVLTLWGWPRFARRHPAEGLFIVAAALPVIWLFSLYTFWHGDGSWGPRYLVPVLPLLLLPILPMLEQATRATPARDGGRQAAFSPGRLAVSSTLALGFLVNALGAAVNFDTYINVVEDLNTRHWLPYASPIPGHLTLLQQRGEEWGQRLWPADGTTLFKSGFSYSEGDKSKGEALPRWTTGRGEMEVRPRTRAAAPVEVTIRLSDHRPPTMPRANVTIAVDGTPVTPQVRPVEGQPAASDYLFSMEGRATSLVVQSDTWNPSELEEGARNETLGVRMESITLGQNGQELPNTLVDYAPAPPYYPQPRWYYDPGTHHLADVWPVYLSQSGMGRSPMLALALSVVIAGGSLTLFGVRTLGISEQTIDKH